MPYRIPLPLIWIPTVLMLSSAACRCDLQTTVDLGRDTKTLLVSVSPPALEFGPLPAGASSEMDVVVTNIGTGSVTIRSLNVTGDVTHAFSVQTSPVTLSPGAALPVQVLCQPTHAGPGLTADLEIQSNATNEPVVVVPLTAAVQACVNTADGGTSCTCAGGSFLDGGVCVLADAGVPADGGPVPMDAGPSADAGPMPRDAGQSLDAGSCPQGDLLLDGGVCVASPHPPISMSYLTVCAIKPDWTLWCWGRNWNGEVGDGTLLDRSAPVQVMPGTQWQSVGAGWSHACAVRLDGSLWCWGDNTYGELGIGSTGSNPGSPVRVGTLTTWTTVSLNQYTSCALQNDGSLWCWGQTLTGQNTTTNELVPTRVSAQQGQQWTAIASGWGFHCGLQSDHTLWCWGAGGEGQLADNGSPSSYSVAPKQVAGAWLSVSASIANVCAIDASHALWCWGENWPGQFGFNDTNSENRVPVEVPGTPDWALASVGWQQTCAIQTNGSLWCTGTNTDGQVGVGDLNTRMSFTQVGSARDWTAIASGEDSTCGQESTGAFSCWGWDAEGEVGDGVPAPTEAGQVQPGTSWKAVGVLVSPAGSPNVEFGVRSDGTLWSWANDAVNGVQAQAPTQVTTTASFETITSGGTALCGIDSLQHLLCLGPNTGGEVGDGTMTTRWTPVQIGSATWLQVSTGTALTCGVQSTGSLWCWGNNNGPAGQGPNAQPATPTHIGSLTWSAVAVGDQHVCGVSAGAVYCWGNNYEGQLGNGTLTASTTPVEAGTFTNAVALYAGKQNSCARDATGAMWCWGVNFNNQIPGATSAEQETPLQLAGSSWEGIDYTQALICGIAGGSLNCWGQFQPQNPFLGTGPNFQPPGTWSSVAVVSAFTVLAIRTDGTLWSWGANDNGERGDGAAWRPSPVRLSF